MQAWDEEGSSRTINLGNGDEHLRFPEPLPIAFFHSPMHMFRNSLLCLPMFRLVVSQSGDPFEAVCDGCPVACDGCSFDETPVVPTCSDVMNHGTSTGGNVTLETLSIDPGYWRATSSSKEILACYNADACLGGVTGTAGYCLESYEGPCERCAGCVYRFENSNIGVAHTPAVSRGVPSRQHQFPSRVANTGPLCVAVGAHQYHHTRVVLRDFLARYLSGPRFHLPCLPNRTDCSICSDGYASNLGYTCSKCFGRASGIAFAVGMAVLAVFVAVVVIMYIMSGEAGGRRIYVFERFGWYVPLQSVKIVIVSWQILTQVGMGSTWVGMG